MFVQSYSYNRPFDGSHNVEVALSENEFDSLWYKYLRHDVFNITAAVFSCQSFGLPHPAVIINPVLLLPSMPPVPAVSLPGYLCFSVSSSL